MTDHFLFLYGRELLVKVIYKEKTLFMFFAEECFYRKKVFIKRMYFGLCSQGEINNCLELWQ